MAAESSPSLQKSTTSSAEEASTQNKTLPNSFFSKATAEAYKIDIVSKFPASLTPSFPDRGNNGGSQAQTLAT